jgi:hypothetical protein
MIAGAKALPRTHAARPAAAAHTTGRQRRDGSVPVGNSNSTKTTNPTPNSQIQPIQWAQITVRGNCSSSSPKAPAA